MSKSSHLLCSLKNRVWTAVRPGWTMALSSPATRSLGRSGGEEENPHCDRVGSAGSRTYVYYFIVIIFLCYFHLHLIIFPEPPPGPFPEPRGRDGVGAVNVAPVNEGGDRVKLLPDAGTAAATEMRILNFYLF